MNYGLLPNVILPERDSLYLPFHGSKEQPQARETTHKYRCMDTILFSMFADEYAVNIGRVYYMDYGPAMF